MTPEEIKKLQDDFAALQAKTNDLTSQLEKVSGKNKELLDEAKAAKAKVVELENASKGKTEEDARKSGDFKTLWEIAQSKLSQIEADVKDREAKDAELQAKVLRTEQEKAFRAELGGELVHDDFLKLVTWDKVIVDPNVTDKISFNKDGLKQTVDEFKSKYGSTAIKSSSAGDASKSKLGVAADGAKRSDPNDSFAARAVKAGIV